MLTIESKKEFIMLFKWFSRLLHTLVFIISVFIFTYIFAPILVEASPMTNVFINEIHYDNNGGDTGEYVEIAGDANIDLTGWSLLLYNGSNGKMYNSFNFNSWSTIDINTQFGFHAIKTTGIQNGSPDGVALFDGINIIQFLSYEGSFTASAGYAEGMKSTDIDVSENSSTPLGFSLQLTGQGSRYSDFTWSSPQASTFGTHNLGASNKGQQLIKPIRNITSVNEPSSLLLFFLVLISIIILSKRNSNLIYFAPPVRPELVEGSVSVYPEREAVEGPFDRLRAYGGKREKLG